MLEDGLDNLTFVRSEDQEMLNAINQARQSIHGFLETFFNPKPNQKSFLLKIVFEDHERIEHIWLADLDLDSSPPTGLVANETSFPGLQYMSRVDFSANRITDWMYLEDNFLVGGFTTRLLQARKAKNQGRGLKRFLPWRKNV